MAYIEKRTGAKGTTYRAQIRGKHGEASKSFKRLTDAREWAATTEAELAKGVYFAHRRAAEHSVADAIDAYMDSPKFAVLARQDVERQRLQWWRDKYGKLPLARFDAGAIAGARDKLAKQISPASVNRYLARISAVLKHARRELRWISVNQVSDVTKMREPQGRERYLSPGEQSRLLDACKESRSPDLYAFVITAMTTGARRGELEALEWRDVDTRRGALTFRNTKNGETRTVPVVGPALDALRDKAKVRELREPRVFPGKYDTAWDRALERAEISDFRFHDLRHTAASYLAMSGASLREIADVLGHRTLAMVRRYSHLSQQHTADVMRRMVEKHIAVS